MGCSIPDFKRSIATSIESEHGSLIRALSGEMPSMEGEMVRYPFSSLSLARGLMKA